MSRRDLEYSDEDLQMLLSIIYSDLRSYKKYVVDQDKSKMGIGGVAKSVIECCEEQIGKRFAKVIKMGKVVRPPDTETQNFIL